LKIWDLLAQGPQRASDVYDAAMPLVPPGMAWRRREEERKRQNQRIGLVHQPRPITDRAIMVGQRREVYVHLAKIVRNGSAEYFSGPDGETWIRRGERMSPEDRTEAQREGGRKGGIKGWAKLTPAQRTARAKRAWATKRSLKQSSEQLEPSTRG